MDERALFAAHGLTLGEPLPLDARARAATRDLWARGGPRALVECAGRCGTLLLPPRAWCRDCITAGERRKAPGIPPGAPARALKRP